MIFDGGKIGEFERRKRLTVPLGLINLNILEWAIKKKGLSISNIAKRTKIKEARIHKLLGRGKLVKRKDEGITYRQLNKMADILRIPVGYFFLKDLPEEYQIDIPDLRRSKDSIPLSDSFYEIYLDVKKKQEWLREKRIKMGFTPLPFVGKFSTIDDPGMIAQDIQETLKIKESDFKEAQDQLRIYK